MHNNTKELNCPNKTCVILFVLLISSHRKENFSFCFAIDDYAR